MTYLPVQYDQTTPLVNATLGSVGVSNTLCRADHVHPSDPKTNPIIGQNVQTANYTFALTDAGLFVVMNSASTNTVTVPPNSSVAFPVGTVISLLQLGAGTTSLVAGSGVTFYTASTSYGLRAQYSVGSLWQRATNVWQISGDFL